MLFRYSLINILLLIIMLAYLKVTYAIYFNYKSEKVAVK